MKGIIKKISSVILLIALLIQPVAQILFNVGISNADSTGRYVMGNDINDIKWKYNPDRENCELICSDVQYRVTFTTGIHSYGMNKKYYNLIRKGSVFTCQSDNFRYNVSDPDVANSVNMYVTELTKSEKNRDIDGTLTGSYLTKWYPITDKAPTDSMWIYISQGGGLQVDRKINATVTVAEKRYVWQVWNKGSKRPGTQTFTTSNSSKSDSAEEPAYVPTYTTGGNNNTPDPFIDTDEPTAPIEEPDPEINIPDDSKRLYIRDLYKRALLREPGNSEIEWYMDQTVQQAAINIMLSEEADSKSNANALTYKSFVEYCYNVILGRSADASAINNYAEALDNGEITKVKLIKRLLNSDEFMNSRNKEVTTITLDEKLCTAVYNNLLKQDIQVIKPNKTTIKMYKDKIANVKTLDISGKGITSLSGLGTFNQITKLLAQNNSISDVSELTKLTQLKYLNLNNNNTKTTINKVTNIKTIEELYLDNNSLQDSNISTIYNLTNLKVLSLNKNELSSVPSIKSLTNLKELYLDSNKIRNIAVIEQANLNKVSIKNNTSSFNGTSESTVLPEIIKNAKDKSSKIYTSQNFVCSNCKIEGNALVLNEGKKTGTVTVKGGNADGCTFTYKNNSNTLVFEDAVLADKIQSEISKLVISRTEDSGKIYIKVKSDSLAEVTDLDLSSEPGEPQITNLSGLEMFGGLYSLDLSGNNITDFSSLNRLYWLETLKVRNCNLSDLNCLNNFRGGNGLKNLDASNNRIADISDVSNTPKLNKLLLTNNNIQNNLTPLKSLTKLDKLYIGNNNITDISAIKGLDLSILVCSDNSINNDNLSSFAKTVNANNNNSTKTTDNNGSLDIPDEVKNAINSGNNSVEYVNCAIKNNKISLNEGYIKGKVIIKNGNFSGSVVNVNAPIDTTPPEINVNYRRNTQTGEIEAVVTSNEELQDLGFFKMSEDKKTLVKSYGYNTREVLYFYDLSGNKTQKEINITQFDNNRIPGLQVTVSNNNIEYNVTNENVTVTISADVPLHRPDYGNYWTISADGKTLTRTFDTLTSLYQTIQSQENYELEENLRHRILDGETGLDEEYAAVRAKTVSVRLQIPNIDKVAPQCGVEYSTTQTTTGSVRATIWSNEKIRLADNKGIDVTETTKLGDNGNTVYGLTLFYTQNRADEFAVSDLAGNQTSVNVSVNNIDNGIDGLTSKQNGAIISNQNTSVTVKANENITLANNTRQGSLSTQFAKTFKQVVRQARVYKVANISNGELGLITTLADNNQQNSQQQISYDLDYNDVDTLDITDNAGNVDSILYAVNSVDKEAPVVLREKDVKNNDGSITVKYWVNEKLANIEQLSGWTFNEEQSTITKTFNTNTKELLELEDLAGNKSEEEVVVKGVNKVNYEVTGEYNEKSNQYYIEIKSETKLQKVDGWDISEDGKTLHKIMNPDEEEIVYIEDYEGNGSEVMIVLTSSIEQNATEDDTIADKVIPQTGKYSIIAAVIIIIILIGLTFITLKDYWKNED